MDRPSCLTEWLTNWLIYRQLITWLTGRLDGSVTENFRLTYLAV
jgi:hypothetical protein